MLLRLPSKVVDQGHFRMGILISLILQKVEFCNFLVYYTNI